MTNKNEGFAVMLAPASSPSGMARSNCELVHCCAPAHLFLKIRDRSDFLFSEGGFDDNDPSLIVR